ncbi:protein phosphatase 2C domain-containing protein [Paenibacillus dokdonensis]|uniref:Protein phosphatase 2C domain-containing protein n=1 Tax=Paenibacillus dokdonensis TaxID=2567944 RepID=A0ABU6GN99_9BACL|nr:protein phosphatase 2C domain-containing protein [Paenibacillus dokdonensis]MEC0241234.1 protein phosphatase 2C domain-containing protein [Paenibacillus dokdonensis]
MAVHHISIQGTGEWNEDAVVLNEKQQLYGVIDGATSLVPFRGANNETGGRLASQLLQRYFEQLTSEDCRDLETLTNEANFQLGEEMRVSGIRMDDKRELWTAAIAIIRITDHHIEYAQAGDCMLMALYRDGSVRTITRDHVSHIGDVPMTTWKEGIASGIRTKAALREKVQPLLLRNKDKMNTDDGYSVLNGLPDAEKYIEYGKINRIQLAGLLLVTDGLFYPEEWPNTASENEKLDEKLLRRVASDGLENYAEWLLSLEKDDPECIRYPRFKISDDKSGVWITF